MYIAFTNEAQHICGPVVLWSKSWFCLLAMHVVNPLEVISEGFFETCQVWIEKIPPSALRESGHGSQEFIPGALTSTSATSMYLHSVGF